MTQISGSPLRSDRYAICVASGDHAGSNSGPGECVSRVRSVPSALIVHTSSKLSNAIRPESEERFRLVGACASEAAADGDARSCGCSRSDAPLHAPSTRAPAREIVRMRRVLTPSCTRLLARRFPHVRLDRRTRAALLRGFADPLPDSNWRPLSMKKGCASSGRLSVSPSQGGYRGGGWRAVLISLSPPRVGGQGRWEFAPVAQLLRGRQAARGSVAPLGAKGWLRVSMCQIASLSRRARSIWATLAPRCLPMRALVCW